MFVRIETGPFVQSFKQLEQRMGDEGFEAFWRATKDAKESQQEYGYQNKTGKLTDSMSFETTRKGAFSWAGEVKTSAKYALFVDKPTKAHWIFPKSEGHPLRFYWYKVGAWVAFWHVKHPGTAGAGFSEHARQHFNVRAPAMIQRSLDSVASNG
jgi:hypothetical protein